MVQDTAIVAAQSEGAWQAAASAWWMLPVFLVLAYLLAVRFFPLMQGLPSFWKAKGRR